jgi:hypothetical protein
MSAVVTKLRRLIGPGALFARRDVRLIAGGLVAVAVVIVALRIAGVGFDRMAAWLPTVVDGEHGAVSSPAVPANLPADDNVPPPEGDADAPATTDNSDTVNPGPPPAGDVSPPPEP